MECWKEGAQAFIMPIRSRYSINNKKFQRALYLNDGKANGAKNVY